MDSKTIRVAAASTDGYTVDTHYGRANTFYIYQYFGDEWIFVEKRVLKPVCLGGLHEVESMNNRAEHLTDCQYVVASRIGAGAIASLQQKNITPMSLPGDLMEVLDKIYSYNEIQNLFN